MKLTSFEIDILRTAVIGRRLSSEEWHPNEFMMICVDLPDAFVKDLYTGSVESRPGPTSMYLTYVHCDPKHANQRRKSCNCQL